MTGVIHDFDDSLKSALTYNNQELLEQACREFFLAFDHMSFCPRYSQHPSNLQARGVDWCVSLKDPNGHGRVVMLDDKMSTYPDDTLFLEVWADQEKTRPGWITDPKKVCDYIAFLKPKRSPPTVYFLPFHPLQRAWKRRGDQWTDEYGLKAVSSKRNGQTWKIFGVPVPAPQIYEAMTEAMVIPVPS